MNIAEYQVFAMRTAKVMDTKGMLVHGAMGVSSEVGELAEAMFRPAGRAAGSVQEELGDMAWFIAYMMQALGYSVSQFGRAEYMYMLTNMYGPSIQNAHVEMNINAGEILSLVKGHAFYGKGLDVKKLVEHLTKQWHLLIFVCELYNQEVIDMLNANILKLAARYPDKYSDTAAQARADKAADDGVHSIQHGPAETLARNREVEALDAARNTDVTNKNVAEVRQVLAGDKRPEDANLHRDEQIRTLEGKVQSLTTDLQNSEATNVGLRDKIRELQTELAQVSK
mgnify:CR=1 FL=1